MLGSFFLALWCVLITCAGSSAHLIPLEVKSASNEIIVVEMTRAFLVGMDVGTVIPGLIGAIVFAALLALIHSTYDSFLQVGAATFARDVLGTFIDDDPKLLSWVGKQAAIGISVLGLIIGVFFDSIIDALIFGYTIWVPSLLGPFLFCIFSKKESFAPRSFIAAYLLGVTAWIVCDYVVTLPWYFSYVPGIAYGLLLSLVTLFLLERNQTVVSVEAN